MKRRLLSILLLICMTLTLFPVSALAEEGETEAPVCVCTEACTEEAVNYDCPVCGAEGAQACACEEVIAADDTDDAPSDADDADAPDDAPEAPDDVKKVHAVKDPGSTDAAHSTYAADTPAAEEAATGVTYILNYYLNDGTDSHGEIFNVKNEITITQVPTRDGYDFLGWADTSDAVEAQYQPGTPIIITEGTEKTVYAVWKLRPLETVVVTPPTLPKEVYIGLTFTDDSLKAGGGVAKVKGTDTVVPGKFTFNNKYGCEVNAAGENRLRVYFIPDDQETYAAAECEIIVIGLKHTIAEVRTKIAITDKPLGTPAEELGITATSVEVKTNVGTLYNPIPVTWDLSTYDPNGLGTQIIYGTLDVANSWYAYAINEETDVKATIEVTLIDTRVFDTTIIEAPVISRTFYALEHYGTLEANLTGGVAMADGKVVEGKFSFDENEPLYGGKAWPGTSLKYGELTRKVVFTPANSRNYTTATCTVTVNVLPLKAIQIASFYTPITDKPLGTEFADLGLGKEISFVVSENWDDPADEGVYYTDKVIWDESKYDKNSPYEQTVTGTLVLSDWKDYILLPDEPLTLSVKVKLKYDPVEPTIVTAPVFRWTKGDYALGDNQIFIGKFFQIGTKNITEEAAETGAFIGGEAMADGTKVNGTFSIKEGTPKWFDAEGQHDVTVVFTPDDLVLYAPAECTIKLDAIKRTVASIDPCPDVTDEEVGTAFEKLWKPLVYIRTEDGTIEHGVGVIWDETAYDPYTIEEQTITGTLKIDGYFLGGYIKQPEPEIKPTLKVKLKTTENTVEIRYHIYNPDGDVEYKTDGTSAILTDYTTTLDDYDLRGFGAIFQALQAAGMFTGLDEAGSVLDGWYKAYSFADTDRVADLSQLTVTGKRVDLYGKIIPKTITITLELGGGELPEGVSSTVTRTYGSWYDLPKPTRHGYSFTYWSTAETGGSEIFPATRIMQTTDHTVYARWKQIADHSPVREQKPEALAKAATCTENAVYYMSCSCGEIIKTETFTAENTAGHDYGNWTSNHDGTHTGVCSRNASHTVTEACSGGSAYCMERAVCEKCKTEYGELGGHIFGSDWKCDNTYHWHECSGCKGVDSKVLHADNDKDHRCDACYHLLGTCADSNNDHKCDVCGKQLSECADNDNDHLCDTCGKKLTEHAGGTATCTARAVCDICGKEYGELIPHSFTAENTDAKYLKTAATCMAKAVYYKSCAVCGAAGTETFEHGEPVPHTFTAETAEAKFLKTAATCTAKAVYYKSCAVCGAAGTETFEHGEPAPHSFTAETADAKYLKTAATCTAKAAYYKSCAACGLSSKGTADEATFEAGNALGHDYGSWTSNGDGTHTGVCSHDAGHTKTEACSGGTATCVKKAVCKVCGKEYGEKDSDNHSGREEWTVTESTHEQKWSCCGKVTVSAEGHSFGEWVVIKRPTYSQQGIRMHTCGSCGYYETESIPATGKTPQTGDDSALGLWSLLMCASFTGVLSLTAFGLRQRTKKKQ